MEEMFIAMGNAGIVSYGTGKLGEKTQIGRRVRRGGG